MSSLEHLIFHPQQPAHGGGVGIRRGETTFYENVLLLFYILLFVNSDQRMIQILPHKSVDSCPAEHQESR